MINATKFLTAPKRSRPVSLLMVEDNDDHWQLTRSAFYKIAPHVVLTRATSGEQAYAYLEGCLLGEQSIPALVLLDLYLPTPAVSWQLLTRIQQYGAPLDQLPVVILSYSHDADEIVQSYRSGARAYLKKPALYEEWIALLNQLSTYWLDTVTLPVLRPVF